MNNVNEIKLYIVRVVEHENSSRTDFVRQKTLESDLF